jgi:diguanylate cyclase (GGDEF)-like protein
MLTLSVVQDSYHMAYRDELSGLPGRRALNEALPGLGRHYTVAMLDVDHFKRFNTRYGHDVGDQVLKMVAARMMRVGGGGRPFRYGGEEFTVIFPRKSADEAIPHLEALRQSIAASRLVLRGADRPSQAKQGREMRGSKRGGNGVAVTISIGVAQRDEQHKTPEAVVKAADQALYRAKNKGRNQTSC